MLTVIKRVESSPFNCQSQLYRQLSSPAILSHLHVKVKQQFS